MGTHTKGRRKKKKRDNNKELIKGKKRTVKRLKSGAGLELWKYSGQY